MFGKEITVVKITMQQYENINSIYNMHFKCTLESQPYLNVNGIFLLLSSNAFPFTKEPEFTETGFPDVQMIFV